MRDFRPLVPLALAIGWSAPASAESLLVAASVPDVTETLQTVIRSSSAIVAFFFVLQLLHAVFLVLTHGDEDEKKVQAHAILKEAMIGIAVVTVVASLARPAAAAVLTGGAYLIHAYAQ